MSQHELFSVAFGMLLEPIGMTKTPIAGFATSVRTVAGHLAVEAIPHAVVVVSVKMTGKTATKLFCFRSGVFGRDITRFFGWNEKTGRRMNRVFRSMAAGMKPKVLPGFSEWNESVPIRLQWVLGGVFREIQK